MTKAYLLGVLHDATERKTTYRVSQKSKDFVEMIARGIKSLGGNAWTYREGRERDVYIVEFSKSFLRDARIKSSLEKIDYIRGYFDAEGGVPKSRRVRFYLYFAQKNLPDLEEVRGYLVEAGIACGRVHNPSRRADPDYWRFYVRAASYKDFARTISSWHPEKLSCLRMMR